MPLLVAPIPLGSATDSQTQPGGSGSSDGPRRAPCGGMDPGTADSPVTDGGDTGVSAAEIATLLLMAIGGILLPLAGPAVGVVLMRSTPRWTARQVKVTWGILGVGLVALLVGVALLAWVSESTPETVRAALLALGIVVAVGPAAALYAATRPRPTG
jgi:hypothetical protein